MPTVNSGCSSATVDNSCSTLLPKYYQAYTALLTGQSVQRIQTADFRTVDYTPGNIGALVVAYNALWDQCGAGSGLPRLKATAAGASIRGGPAVFGC